MKIELIDNEIFTLKEIFDNLSKSKIFTEDERKLRIKIENFLYNYLNPPSEEISDNLDIFTGEDTRSYKRGKNLL